MTAPTNPTKTLDLLCAGRLNVDLYSEQLAAQLSGVASFRKYLGGSAANVCVGAARLGVRTGLLSGVGDEPMGDFLLNELENGHVNIAGVKRDPRRMSGVVMLALRPSEDYPRLFFYQDSADLGLEPEDVDPQLVASSRCLLLTGSYLCKDNLREVVSRLISLARRAATKIVLDIDFRPVLWGLVPARYGAAMTSPSEALAQALSSVLPHCDLVVGTKEEILAAAAEANELDQALTTLKRKTTASIVVKAGPAGCTVYERQGERELDPVGVPGVPVAVLNTVGAGDAFLAGLLSGWLAGETLQSSAQRGNAAGALVATRHGCTPAMPTRDELDYFIENAHIGPSLAHSPRLQVLHRVGTRRPSPRCLYVLALDHRWQLEALFASRPEASGCPAPKITRFKELVYEGYLSVARSRQDTGLLIDDLYGHPVIERETGSGRWLARAAEVPRSRPVELLGEPDVASWLHTWPTDHVVKVIAYWHPSDPPELRAQQRRQLVRAQHACAQAERELLLELQPPEGKDYAATDAAEVMADLYAAGVSPEWWKLPPMTETAAWLRAAEVAAASQGTCRGLLVLGQTSTAERLDAALSAAAAVPLCRGFAVGRHIFASAAQDWFNGTATDEEVVRRVGKSYEELISAWENKRKSCQRPSAPVGPSPI